MNNSQLIQDVLEEEPADVLPLLRERASQLTEIIEALRALSQSNYWHVLTQYEFDGDLKSLTNRLEKEKETVEIFKLQGEIKRVRKYDLSRLLAQRLKELETLKIKLHEPNYGE